MNFSDYQLFSLQIDVDVDAIKVFLPPFEGYCCYFEEHTTTLGQSLLEEGFPKDCFWQGSVGITAAYYQEALISAEERTRI